MFYVKSCSVYHKASVVLNIAEGNGRFEVGDRRKFLEMAESLSCQNGGLPRF